MQCLPSSLINKIYYRPGTQGKEIKLKERLEAIKKWKNEHKDSFKI